MSFLYGIKENGDGSKTYYLAIHVIYRAEPGVKGIHAYSDSMNWYQVSITQRGDCFIPEDNNNLWEQVKRRHCYIAGFKRAESLFRSICENAQQIDRNKHPLEYTGIYESGFCHRASAWERQDYEVVWWYNTTLKTRRMWQIRRYFKTNFLYPGYEWPGGYQLVELRGGREISHGCRDALNKVATLMVATRIWYYVPPNTPQRSALVSSLKELCPDWEQASTAHMLSDTLVQVGRRNAPAGDVLDFYRPMVSGSDLSSMEDIEAARCAVNAGYDLQFIRSGLCEFYSEQEVDQLIAIAQLD